jgi:hypothetical protein
MPVLSPLDAKSNIPSRWSAFCHQLIGIKWSECEGGRAGGKKKQRVRSYDIIMGVANGMHYKVLNTVGSHHGVVGGIATANKVNKYVCMDYSVISAVCGKPCQSKYRGTIELREICKLSPSRTRLFGQTQRMYPFKLTFFPTPFFLTNRWIQAKGSMG